MNLIVLHGEDTVKSYIRLVSFITSAKKRNFTIIRTDWANLEMTLRNEGLFAQKELIILHGIAGAKKSDLDLLKRQKESGKTIVIYSNTQMTPSQLKKFGADTKVEYFGLPKKLFVFLEAVFPGNGVGAFKLLKEVLMTENVQLVFTMLGRHLKDLYWASESPNDIPYPSWRVAKLENQATKFDDSNIISKLLNKLVAIDYKSKTTSSEISEMLDDFLLMNLQ